MQQDNNKEFEIETDINNQMKENNEYETTNNQPGFSEIEKIDMKTTDLSIFNKVYMNKYMLPITVNDVQNRRYGFIRDGEKTVETIENSYKQHLTKSMVRIVKPCQVLLYKPKLTVKNVEVNVQDIIKNNFEFYPDYSRNKKYNPGNLSHETITDFIPKTEKLFRYDGLGDANKASIKKYMIDELNFNPYNKPPLFDFKPFYFSGTDRDPSYTTFGLKQKFDDALYIQKGITGYVTKMISSKFKEITDYIIKEKMDMVSFFNCGLLYIYNELLTKMNVTEHGYDTFNYDKEIDDSYRNTVLYSEYLNWYKSNKDFVKSKVEYDYKYRTEQLEEVDSNYKVLVNEDSSDSLYYFTFKSMSACSKNRLGLFDVITNVIYENALDSERRIILKYLCELTISGVQLGNQMFNLVKYFKKVALKTVSGSGKCPISDNVISGGLNDVRIPEIRFDSDVRDNNSSINKIFDLLDGVTKELKNMMRYGLNSKYIQELDLFGKKVIYHPYLDYDCLPSDFLYINIKSVAFNKKEKKDKIDNDEIMDEEGNVYINDRIDNYEDEMEGKSIVFKAQNATIILYKLHVLERYNVQSRDSDVKGLYKDKSEIDFETVIVVWGNRYLIFGSDESTNEYGLYYKSYHSKNTSNMDRYGKKERIDTSSVMIEFHPDMNVFKPFTEEQAGYGLRTLHDVLKGTYFIMDEFFGDYEIDIISIQSSNTRNLLRLKPDDNTIIEFQLTEKDIEKSATQKELGFRLTQIDRIDQVNGEKKIVNYYKDGKTNEILNDDNLKRYKEQFKDNIENPNDVVIDQQTWTSKYSPTKIFKDNLSMLGHVREYSDDVTVNDRRLNTNDNNDDDDDNNNELDDN